MASTTILKVEFPPGLPLKAKLMKFKERMTCAEVVKEICSSNRLPDPDSYLLARVLDSAAAAAAAVGASSSASVPSSASSSSSTSSWATAASERPGASKTPTTMEQVQVSASAATSATAPAVSLDQVDELARKLELKLDSLPENVRAIVGPLLQDRRQQQRHILELEKRVKELEMDRVRTVERLKGVKEVVTKAHMERDQALARLQLQSVSRVMASPRGHPPGQVHSPRRTPAGTAVYSPVVPKLW
mmetsp:Transcript_4646/g.11531  ORF Transcript_4646/g.11531 Transcript_4646/m.11531 type:complete len:246 (-) Transcript_4646:99-836(-)